MEDPIHALRNYINYMYMNSMKGVSCMYKLKHLVKDNINIDGANFVKELTNIINNNLTVCNMTQTEIRDILDFVITR